MRVAPPELHPGVSPLVNSRKSAKQVTLHLPQPHPKQYELLNSFNAYPHVRFVVGACGTKFGKTYGSTIWLVQEAWTNKNSLNWWVAPTFSQAKMAYGLVKRLLPLGTYIEYKADMRLTLMEPDGSEHSVLEFKSADNPDSLRGFAVNSFVLDEAARFPYDSFVSVITTVTQTMGHGIIISTPKGRGWFHDVYHRGEKKNADGTDRFYAHSATCARDYSNPDDDGCSCVGVDPFPEYMSIRMPTWTNPHVKMAAVRDAKRTLPEDVFTQEFAAEFIDDSAGVFRNVKGCIHGDFQDYIPGHYYVMGVDLARLRDYSVLTVLDVITKHVVYVERFNKVDWEIQYHRIMRVAKHYNARVCIDWTGIGDPIVQTLQNAGLDVDPYKIGGSMAKQQLIEKLRVNIENERISIPQNRWTTVMLEELRSYEYTFTEAGRVQYSAPSGGHDDCVISLALANLLADVPAFKYRSWSQRGI